MRNSFNAVELAVFSGRLSAICEEMGTILQKSAVSPNIKDRLDFSCAFFDHEGRIMAQAAHIPVHLGSMAFAMQGIVSRYEWFEGDMLVLNDPFMGGTHLPDVTLIAPFYYAGELLGFVANRAHHANIGCQSAGSMPLSKRLSEEGVLIVPVKLFTKGALVTSVVSLLARIDQSKGQKAGQAVLAGDFLAQVSANQTGLKRLTEWFKVHAEPLIYFQNGLKELNLYGTRLALKSFDTLPQGEASFTDYMDSDGFGSDRIPIVLRLKISKHSIELDFKGTAHQVDGNINCPVSVCAAAVYYVFASLLPEYVPHCYGVFECIEIEAPYGCLVHAESGAAVSAGNVETSMRIVDVVLGALAKLGVNVPAASQGTMNNVAMGGEVNGQRWDYYETIGGGSGAGQYYNGLSASQCHMTNTLNTPIESLEMHYPLRITQYAIRTDSGGSGLKQGGEGIIREYAFLLPTCITLLTERRVMPPWGLRGGADGREGVNLFNCHRMPGKVEINASKGDCLQILTPGGGGFGQAG